MWAGSCRACVVVGVCARGCVCVWDCVFVCDVRRRATQVLWVCVFNSCSVRMANSLRLCCDSLINDPEPDLKQQATGWGHRHLLFLPFSLSLPLWIFFSLSFPPSSLSLIFFPSLYVAPLPSPCCHRLPFLPCLHHPSSLFPSCLPTPPKWPFLSFSFCPCLFSVCPPLFFLLIVRSVDYHKQYFSQSPGHSICVLSFVAGHICLIRTLYVIHQIWTRLIWP